jgi:hypothetical protein
MGLRFVRAEEKPRSGQNRRLLSGPRGRRIEKSQGMGDARAYKRQVSFVRN